MIGKPNGKIKMLEKVTNKKLLLFALTLSVLLSAYPVSNVLADRFDEQMNALRQENSQAQAADELLEVEEQGLNDVLARIQGEITAIEAQIRQNEAARDKTAADIAAAEVELKKQQDLLGQNVRLMYLEGQTSTLEMLATSKNLSDFVDKKAYRTAVGRKVTETVQKINTLRANLESQKATLEKLLADQQAMQGRLAAQRAEQNRLISLNQEQQAEYQQQINQNNSKIGELRRQQILENARFTGTGSRKNIPDTTGYPWASAPFPNSIVDPWGMYQRQCVSYTAWKVWKSGRFMPYWGGVGNAKQWDDNARRAGIPVDGNPRVGDVGVSNRGEYGHVVYVEAVYDDGTIYISQYNAGWDGRYSEARIQSAGLEFIHF